MTNNLRVQVKECRLLIEGDCNFGSVAKLDNEKSLPALIQSLPENIQVDLSGINNSSSAILPLLLQIKRCAETFDKRMQLVEIPERLVAMIKLAELDNLLLS